MVSHTHEFYEIVDLLLSNITDWVGQKELTSCTNTYYPEAHRERFETAIQKVLDRHTVFQIRLDGVGDKQSYENKLRWDPL